MPTLAAIHIEHNHIFKTLSELKEQAETIGSNHEAESSIITQISELLAYVALHFEHEEEMMKNLNFFDYDGHKETHALFIKMSSQLYNTLLDEPSYLPVVIRIFTNWFTTHFDIEMFLFARAVSRAKREALDQG